MSVQGDLYSSRKLAIGFRLFNIFIDTEMDGVGDNVNTTVDSH